MKHKLKLLINPRYKNTYQYGSDLAETNNYACNKLSPYVYRVDRYLMYRVCRYLYIINNFNENTSLI